jgi:hypothetical protein
MRRLLHINLKNWSELEIGGGGAAEEFEHRRRWLEIYDACFKIFYFREAVKLKIEKKDGRKLSAKKPDENVLKN